MAFDGFTNYAVATELNKALAGGKINKVYQPSKNELILTIYSQGKKYNLLINISAEYCRMNLTSTLPSNPSTPYNFCMILRKYLVGGKIKEIKTKGLDRITYINFETYNDMNDLVIRRLVVELMGRYSNLILTNENNVIIDAMRHINSNTSGRIILPANPYVTIEDTRTQFIDVSEKSFARLLSNTNSLTESITSQYLGFTKTHLAYVLNYLDINDSSFLEKDIKKLYNYFKSLINNIGNNKIEPFVYTVNKKENYVLISSKNEANLKINEFIDNLYTQKEKTENFENYQKNVLKIILSLLKKYENRLANIDRKLEESKERDKYRIYGELLTNNLYQLKDTNHLSSVHLPNYYENNKEIEIPLDTRLSPAMNAKQYFKKYNKLKNAYHIVSKQKEETKLELDYIESIIYSLSSASFLEEVDEIYLEIKENLLQEKTNKKKKNIPSAPLKLEIDSHTVYVGKNNKQNDELTFKIAEKEDLWFHAKDIHGSHVILKDSNTASEEVISKCASIAAYYSKASSSSKVEVQYTKVKNIKKPKHSKPGFVVFSTYQSIMVEPKIDF